MKDFIDFMKDNPIFMGAAAAVLILLLLLIFLIIKLVKESKKEKLLSKQYVNQYVPQYNALQHNNPVNNQNLNPFNNGHENNLQNGQRKNQPNGLNFNKDPETVRETPASEQTEYIFSTPSNGASAENSAFGQIPVLNTMDKEALNNSLSSRQASNVTEILTDSHRTNCSEETEQLGVGKTSSQAILTYELNGQTKEFKITETVINLGRDSELCDFIASQDSHIGRKHAIIYNKRNNYYLVDLNSTNGTYVNGERLQGERQLTNGDIVRLAAVSMKFTII